MNPLSQPVPTQEEARDRFLERLLQATSGAMDIFTIYLGDRLGLYNAMADGQPVTSMELAQRTGTQERYIREWLEQQTVTGILQVENPEAASTERRFSLPPAHIEVLTDTESGNYLAPLARMMLGCARPMGMLLDAFRNGGGVPFTAYGPDLREGQAAINRPAFLYELGQSWLPAIPDIHTRLQETPPARIADIGCGGGWSCIGMAKAYPQVRVDGYDVDAPSVELAQQNVLSYHLSDRVHIFAEDAAHSAERSPGAYDLVTAFECVHDMSDPVGVLRAMRQMAKPDGAVIIMDERVGDRFTPEGNDVEWFMYGFSVLHCLPVGMADEPSVGTGTVMRTETLRQYACAAGFREVEVLPIENFFFRFYRLHGI
ncbi:MAG: class I SAM-dependent methyltransferase [Armatimonadaceae bacterium]